MREELKAIGKHLLYWFFVFAVGRLIFLSYYFPTIKSGIGEIFASFLYSFTLDLSTASYLLIVPFLIILLSYIIPINRNRILYIAAIPLTFIFNLITAAELCLYAEWGTKLNLKGLSHLAHPSEVFYTATTSQIMIFLVAVSAQTWASLWFFKTLFPQETISRSIPEKRKIPFALFFTVCSSVFIVLGLRGGLRQIPVNQSDCYYSSENILNLAAVNSAWNLLHSITENPGITKVNPYVLLDVKEASSIVTELHAPEKDTTIYILKNAKPNIVLIILESWSADLIPSCGGDSGATRNFEELAKHGILFTNAYASGDRSDQGMASIFSGFPAQPLTTVIAQPDKFPKLPSLVKKMKEQGYHTSYYFGGQLSYGNIKGYMMSNEMDRIIELDDFDGSIPTGKLGVHDEHVYARQLEELNNTKQPFFSSIFTSSTHSPFDMPLKKFPISWGKNENPYVNSMYYADSCLGDYFRKAALQPWFDNTLFVLVSDHSRNSHRNWEFISPMYHKIPIMLYGKVLKDEYQGMKIDRIISQNDISKTLLTQLRVGSKEFTWSRNALNPYQKPFAYYSFINGLGWVTPEGYYTYDYDLKKYYHNTYPDQQTPEIMNGKAYLQVMFQQYLDF